MINFKTLLLEQETKLEDLRNAISNRLPITINYTGPVDEVKSGTRYDIFPVVLGTNAKSGNMVIWAYVFKGVSKKGLPNWKMFRVDRIVSTSVNKNLKSFNLSQIPGYIKGKAPSMMKSLSNIQIFSPYWLEQGDKPLERPIPNDNIQNNNITTGVTTNNNNTISGDTELVQPNNIEKVITKPELTNRNFSLDVFNNMQSKIKDENGKKIITKIDYDLAINDIYNKKSSLFKDYQRMISGNLKPGSGTRQKYRNEAQKELNDILKKNNIEIENMLSEIYFKFKHLTF